MIVRLAKAKMHFAIGWTAKVWLPGLDSN